MIRQTIGNKIDPAIVVAALNDPAAFFRWKILHFREQRPIQWRSPVGEDVNEHRPTGRDLARLKCARAFVTLQGEELKPVCKWHPVSL